MVREEAPASCTVSVAIGGIFNPGDQARSELIVDSRKVALSIRDANILAGMEKPESSQLFIARRGRKFPLRRKEMQSLGGLACLQLRARSQDTVG